MLALKLEIGPADSPPCGRVPSFEFSNVQNVNTQINFFVSVIWILGIRICFGFRYSIFGFSWRQVGLKPQAESAENYLVVRLK